MRIDVFSAGDAAYDFRPEINRRSCRLLSGAPSVQERQQDDIIKRERHRKELAAKVMEERRQQETFTPVTTKLRLPRSSSSRRSVMNSHSNADTISTMSTRAVVRKAELSSSEETFRPVINARSQRMTAGAATTWQNSHQHLHEVRRWVQALWRMYAGIGSSEITLGGVYGALKELGLQAPSAMVDKFLLALGIDEASGVRCVPYDRFVKVFTVVLRAAAFFPSAVNNNNNNNNNNNIHDCPKIENENVDTSPGTHSGSASQHTMFHVNSVDPSSGRRGWGEVMEMSRMNSSRSSPSPILKTANSDDNNNNDNNFPAPIRPSCDSPREECDIAVRGSYPRSGETRKKKKTYDPLEGCTFTPTINKRIRVVSSVLLTSSSKGKKDEKKDEENEEALPQTKKKTSSPRAYKSREERDLEECTFAPNTAQFHKARDSLTWWKREPCVVDAELNSEAISSSNSSIPRGEPSVRSSDNNKDDGGKKHCRQRMSRSNSLDCRRQEGKGRGEVQHTSHLPITVGFDKAVRRMTEARKKKPRHKFEEILRTSNEEAMMKQGPLRPTLVRPFSLQAEGRHLHRERQKLLLFVDVDLPSGKTGRIGVHRHDEASDLAKRFSDAYGLNGELCQRLESLLTEKLQEVQSTIEHTGRL